MSTRLNAANKGLMGAALYWTVWLSLACFVAGEAGKPGNGRAWTVSALGAALLVVHIVMAMAERHGWSHAAAIAATARQTDDVYGLDWGGGVYVNYLFAGAWIAELTWWRLAPGAYAERPAWIRWTLRAFYLVIIVNAAVIFAAGWRRAVGASLVAMLLMIPTRRVLPPPPRAP